MGYIALVNKILNKELCEAILCSEAITTYYWVCITHKHSLHLCQISMQPSYMFLLYSKCAKINQSTISLERIKKKKLKWNFQCPHLINGSCEFKLNLLCGIPYFGDSYNAKKWCALEKGPWSYACVKVVFFFLSIYSWCGTLTYLAQLHDTLICVFMCRSKNPVCIVVKCMSYVIGQCWCCGKKCAYHTGSEGSWSVSTKMRKFRPLLGTHY